jgi:hypothetical protein
MPVSVELSYPGGISTIHTILGCCEQCESRTSSYVIMVRENGNEAIPQGYCEECLGKRGFLPSSRFNRYCIDGRVFRPGTFDITRLTGIASTEGY